MIGGRQGGMPDSCNDQVQGSPMVRGLPTKINACYPGERRSLSKKTWSYATS